MNLPDLQHWIAVPILLPLATAVLMLLLGGDRRRTKAVINLASTLTGLLLAILLLIWVDRQAEPAAFGVYLPGNWPTPFGIVLVLDRLSALMAVLAGSVGLAALLYAIVRWHHAGVHFHALFQLQLMGLYGAFLTADLFNLFVFFEVLLAASYGLLLHGGGSARVRAGLHYVAINLMASLLFLIGVAVIYGVTGTLNMADIAQKLRLVPTQDRGLLHAGAAILALAFLTKAALWPLNFWLPATYTAASTPVAALFAILTKVGVYATLRLWTLCFPASAGASGLFGSGVLIWGGIATLGFGALGMLAAGSINRVAAFSIIASSGTLLAAIGFNQPQLGSGALFYLTSSTLAGCALFLLVELLGRARQIAEQPAPVDERSDAVRAFSDAEPLPIGNLDDDEQTLVGRAIPAPLAALGVAFSLCALIIAGLPPLSGFIGKLAMLSALIELQRTAAWVLFGALIVSGLMAATALIRLGIRYFWSAETYSALHLRMFELLPVALLLAVCVMLVVRGETVFDYMRATSSALHDPQRYIDAVMSARPIEGVVR